MKSLCLILFFLVLSYTVMAGSIASVIGGVSFPSPLPCSQPNPVTVVSGGDTVSANSNYNCVPVFGPGLPYYLLSGGALVFSEAFVDTEYGVTDDPGGLLSVTSTASWSPILLVTGGTGDGTLFLTYEENGFMNGFMNTDLIIAPGFQPVVELANGGIGFTFSTSSGTGSSSGSCAAGVRVASCSPGPVTFGVPFVYGVPFTFTLTLQGSASGSAFEFSDGRTLTSISAAPGDTIAELPEPGTWGMIAVGLVALAWRVRAIRQRAST